VALRNTSAILGRNKQIVEENMRLLIPFFATYQHLFHWIAPKAGSIAFPRIRFEQDIEQFCTDLVQKQGVMLLPGTCYDFGHKHFYPLSVKLALPTGCATSCTFQAKWL
jgi:aspartate/methionine/tyrosine aminotransferase